MTIDARRRIPETAILVVSQYVEHTYASELPAEGRGGIGYLLRDRIMDVADFVDAVRRVAEGGTALDPEHPRKAQIAALGDGGARRPDLSAARAEPVRVGTARR